MRGFLVISFLYSEYRGTQPNGLGMQERPIGVADDII